MLFIHPQRFQWHNEDPMYDGVRMLSRLRLEEVARQGFVNLRCTWEIGCPGEVTPDPRGTHGGGLAGASEGDDEPSSHEGDAPAGGRDVNKAVRDRTYTDAFRAALPGEPLPPVVGAPCCSQFALTAAAARRRPAADYERMRRWLQAESGFMPAVSGRAFEYLWHVVMGKPAVNCADAGDCFCRLYGLCGLECRDRASCEGRYVLPPFWVGLPKAWPDEGQGAAGLPVDGWWEGKGGEGA